MRHPDRDNAVVQTPDPRRALRRTVRLGSKWLDASAELSRREAVERGRRWRSRVVFIVQCAVAAGLAYAVARYAFRVAVPLFAPVAAMLCLGMSHGQRLRRAAEITIGVAVGALIGETFVHLFGMGVWQVVAIVAVGMSIATILGAGVLMVTQAGVQGLIVALLAAQPTTAFGRWFEALIGSLIALGVAALTPLGPLQRPRLTASAVLTRLSAALIETARGLEQADTAALERALDRARGTEQDLAELRGQVADSLEIARLSPFHRGRREEVRTIAAQLPPLDRSVRNARVLVRRAVTATQTHEHVPLTHLALIWELADVTDLLAEAVATGHPDPDLRATIAQVAREAMVHDTSADLSAEVIRAQVRSILVDDLMVLGHSLDAAQAAVRGGTIAES